MHSPKRPKRSILHPTALSTVLFLLAALAIELVDELVDGANGAAWPQIQLDLSLSYTEVGLIIGLPYVIGSLIDPILGLLADAGYRRQLILGGGFFFVLALIVTTFASGFWSLLLAFIVFFSASGAFVSLTQAALMDADPARREQNMARWALAGSLGNTVGPLLVGLAAVLSLGWRPVFALLAALTVVALILVWRQRSLLGSLTPLSSTEQDPDKPSSVKTTLLEGIKEALKELQRGEVQANLVLLECANLMLDVFRGFLALYFVDTVGATPAQAALTVIVLTGVGLLGDALVVGLLERVSGVWYVRLSALLMALVFPLFLLVPTFGLKLALLGVLGMLNAGWYAVLQARLYDLIPDRSGIVLTIGALTEGLAGGIPILLGVLAEQFGVGTAMRLLLLGPLSLWFGLPRVNRWNRCTLEE